MSGHVLRTTLVGSYPQPDWLIDRDVLAGRVPPRVRAHELWRLPEDVLEAAQDDASRLAVRELEDAGLDILTDGEMRRESYSNHFATALEGLDLERPGVFTERAGMQNSVPRVVGRIRRARPVELSAARVLRASTERQIKVTLPGPFTMSQQAADEFYGDPRELALAYAAAVNEELHELFAAGVDVVQIDEPYVEARPDAARAIAREAIDRALLDAPGTTALHVCFGYGHFIKDKPARYRNLDVLAATTADQISVEAAQPNLDLSCLDALDGKTVMLGVIAGVDDVVETAEDVARRIRAALERVPPERLIVASDCGLKYLSRAVALQKLRALVEGARIVRAELGAA